MSHISSRGKCVTMKNDTTPASNARLAVGLRCRTMLNVSARYELRSPPWSHSPDEPGHDPTAQSVDPTAEGWKKTIQVTWEHRFNRCALLSWFFLITSHTFNFKILTALCCLSISPRTQHPKRPNPADGCYPQSPLDRLQRVQRSSNFASAIQPKNKNSPGKGSYHEQMNTVYKQTN